MRYHLFQNLFEKNIKIEKRKSPSYDRTYLSNCRSLYLWIRYWAMNQATWAKFKDLILKQVSGSKLRILVPKKVLGPGVSIWILHPMPSINSASSNKPIFNLRSITKSPFSLVHNGIGTSTTAVHCKIFGIAFFKRDLALKVALLVESLKAHFSFSSVSFQPLYLLNF